MSLYFNTLRLTRKNRDDGRGQVYGTLHKNRWWNKGIEIVAIMTGRCNLHCDYCPMFLSDNKYPYGKKEECTLEEWKRFFEHFPEWIAQIFISGGEPSLLPWISELINWLVDRGHHVVVLSNLNNVENFYGVKKNFKLIFFPTYHKSANAEQYAKNVKLLKEKTGVEIRSQELEKKHRFLFSIHKKFYPPDWFKYWNAIPHFAPNAPRTLGVHLGCHGLYPEADPPIYLGVDKTYMAGK